VCKNLVYTVILLFIDFFLLNLSFKYTIRVFTKQNMLLNIYIPNFRTFRHFIKKLNSFLFLLKSCCFLYTELSYYSDDIWFYSIMTHIMEQLSVWTSYIHHAWSISAAADDSIMFSANVLSLTDVAFVTGHRWIFFCQE